MHGYPRKQRKLSPSKFKCYTVCVPTHTMQGLASVLWTCLKFHPSMQNTCICIHLHIPGISFMSILLTVSLNPERPGWTFRISACLRSISWWTTLKEKSALAWKLNTMSYWFCQTYLLLFLDDIRKVGVRNSWVEFTLRKTIILLSLNS